MSLEHHVVLENKGVLKKHGAHQKDMGANLEKLSREKFGQLEQQNSNHSIRL